MTYVFEAPCVDSRRDRARRRRLLRCESSDLADRQRLTDYDSEPDGHDRSDSVTRGDSNDRGLAHDTAAVAAYLTGRNTAPQGSDVSQPNASATYGNVASCPLP